jgi:hypothetical protein
VGCINVGPQRSIAAETTDASVSRYEKIEDRQYMYECIALEILRTKFVLVFSGYSIKLLFLYIAALLFYCSSIVLLQLYCSIVPLLFYPDLNMSQPESGRLATHEDLESLGFDLQTWLNMTSPGVLKCGDAWAEGNTDQAFSFNNCTAIQRSHRDNDWNFFGIDLARDGHGTYVYVPKDPYFIKELVPSHVETEEIVNLPINNPHDEVLDVTQTYAETQGQETTITNTEHFGLVVETSIDIEGFSFSLSASFDTTKSEENKKSHITESSLSIPIHVPPRSTRTLKVTKTTTTTQKLYGVDIEISSNHPDGGIAKAPKDKGQWDTFFRIEDVTGKRNKQTAKYNVVTRQVATVVVLE